jgi:hypothetical protein
MIVVLNNDSPKNDDDIEVTPAMIEAGYKVIMGMPELLFYGDNTEKLGEVIADAFRAMWNTRRLSSISLRESKK